MDRGSPRHFQVGLRERTTSFSEYSIVQQLLLRSDHTAPQLPSRKARPTGYRQICGQGAFLGEGMYKTRPSDEERCPFFDALDDVPPEPVQFCSNYSPLRDARPRSQGFRGCNGGSQVVPGGGRVLGGCLARREEVQRVVAGFDEYCEGGNHEGQSQRYRGRKWDATYVTTEPISPTGTSDSETGSDGTGVETRKGCEEECPS